MFSKDNKIKYFGEWQRLTFIRKINLRMKMNLNIYLTDIICELESEGVSLGFKISNIIVKKREEG
jgi:hypothetical protein